VRSVHTKALEYPDDFNPDTGLFKRKNMAVRNRRIDQQSESVDHPDNTRFIDSDVVLERVMRISCAGMKDILIATKGPGANPARRFAIWALSSEAGLSHREIAETLHASQNQVAKALNRMRNQDIPSPLKDWIKRLRNEISVK
jgi:hypothetical protein